MTATTFLCLEAGAGIEPAHEGFADRSVPISPARQCAHQESAIMVAASERQETWLLRPQFMRPRLSHHSKIYAPHSGTVDVSDD